MPRPHQLSFPITLITIAVMCGTAWAKDVPDKDAVADAITPTDEVIRLFDGRTLGDCYTWLKDTKHDDPRQVLRITNGMLHITGDGLGGIITNRRYHDYHLVLEYKWGDRTWSFREHAARDSGLLIHSNGPDGGYKEMWMPSIEVQIIEGGTGDFIPIHGTYENGEPIPVAFTCRVRRDRDNEVVWDPSGKPERFQPGHYRRVNWFGRDEDWEDRRGFRGANDIESPFGQWTRIDVFCERDKIQVFVNGTKVNEAFDVSPNVGRLQLQSELAEIYFRRWELWPLGKGPEPAPAIQ